jgi:CheY-like chemotaxis protein
MSTIEAGQERIQKDEIELNAALKLVHEQFLIKAKNSTVSLALKSIQPEQELWIITDETKLLQVLNNLIGNALKFTKKGYVIYGFEIKDTLLEFFVEDTGIGIRAELHDEIFKRFRQVESTNTRLFGGSGLGLSISKAYVELLGGTMWLQSELGKGATFRFTIPYVKVQRNSLPDNQTIEVQENKIKGAKTILIAEDEDSNFMFLEALLSGSNIKIIRAVNGFEASEICKTNSAIDLVLMDIKMPKMDGYEATRLIMQHKPDLPVIAQTAYSTDDDLDKALASGCSDYICKPINRKLLLSKINTQLNKAYNKTLV